MTRDSRIGIMGLVIAGMVIGSCSRAQMPITRGKGNKPEGIDEGILQGRVFDRFAAPRVPPPPPPPPPPAQARVFVGGANGQRFLTLEPPAAAHGEEQDELDGPPEERPARPPAMPINLQNAVLGRDNFDRWVFGDGTGEEARREHLNSELRKRLVSARRRLGLTPAQESKLGLAAQGDIKRFFDRVEDRRRNFEAARTQFNAGFQFLNSLDPLGKEFEDGPFGDGSLFAKTLRKIENDARAARPSGN